jgi:hypothetical protein
VGSADLALLLVFCLFARAQGQLKSTERKKGILSIQPVVVVVVVVV